MTYFSRALTDTNTLLLGRMKAQLQGVKFDTIVGTGLSGTIFVARVSPALRKHFAIVRKDDDHSTHSDRRVEGSIGNRFIIADDFILSGDTVRHILSEIAKEKGTRTEFVGVYEYQYTPRFRTASYIKEMGLLGYDPWPAFEPV